jgi:RHS repeat-associated protein
VKSSLRRRAFFLCVCSTLLTSLGPQSALAASLQVGGPPPTAPTGRVVSGPTGAPLIASPVPGDPTTGLNPNPVFVGENPPPHDPALVPRYVANPMPFTATPATKSARPSQSATTAHAGASSTSHSGTSARPGSIASASPVGGSGPLNASQPSATCSPTLLHDPSFEYSSVTDWVPRDYAGAVTYAYMTGSGVAVHEGSGYLQTSTAYGSTNGGGSIWQDLRAAPAAGDNYAGSVWVRADAPLATPITGSLSVIAGGMSSTPEVGSTSFSVGNNWTLVSAPLYVANSHPDLGLKLTMNTANVKYDWDAASLENAGMVNPSLEQGSMTGWSNSGGGTQAAAYQDTTVAMDGSWYGQANVAVANNGLLQNLTVAAQPGQSYEASVWVREAVVGQPVSGYLALWSIGGTTETGSTYFTAGPNWQLVQAPLDVQQSGHTGFQFQLILGTTGRNLDFDGMTVVNSCLADASMEYTDTSHWQALYAPPGVTVNYAFYGGGGLDGAGWLEANSTNGTGGAVGQLWNVSVPLGLSFQGGIWVRSHDGTQISGLLAACADGGTTECGNTNFTIWGAWTWVTAPLNVQLSGHNRLRLQVYMNTAGRNFDFDAASWAPTNTGSPLPGAPTAVTASSAGNNGNASVSWSAPTAPIGNVVSSYNVTAFVGGIAAVTHYALLTTSDSFTGLTAKGPYVFAVTANNSAYGTGPPGTSGNVTTVAVPGAVQSLNGLGNNGQVNLSWSAPSSTNGSPITGYAITPYLGGTKPLETMTVGVVTSFSVLNLANGQSYNFHVSAINTAGSGSSVTSNSVIPGLPASPSNVTASGGNGQATVSWTAPSSSGATSISGYTITPYIGSTAQPATTAWGAITSAVVSGLTNGTAYTFKVQALNAYGPRSSGSSGSVTPGATAPGVPRGVWATAGNAQATLSWSPPTTNGGAAITSYKVTPYVAGTPQTPSTFSASPATVTGLTNGTTYTFTVAATNSVGTGAASAQSLAVLPATTPVLPAVTMTTDLGSGATYPVGGVVTYTATVSTNAGSAQAVNFTDSLPAGLDGRGALILVNGSGCTGGVSCSATTSTISVNGLSVPGSGNVVVSYTVVVTGGTRGCLALADSPVATIVAGNSATGPISVVACNAGLGAAAWWSSISQALGAGGSAAVNPADGNLRITQTDAIPMQLHGGISFHLSRTYNSQDTGQTTGLNAALVEPFGAGWIPNFVDVGSDTAAVQLELPTYQSYNNATPVTVIDATGTRYVFTPQPLGAVIDVDGLSTTGVLATAKPVNLARGSGFNRTCIDESLVAPPGIHLSMWRYIETSASNCSSLSSSTTQVLGYALLGVDRVRREFDASGHLLNLRDAVGNEIDYAYNGSAQLTDVTELATGRKFHLAYPSGSETDLTDPGGEITKYTITAGNLTGVLNPDGSMLAYSYATTCGVPTQMLCSASDSIAVNPNHTLFTYSAATLGPAVVTAIQDRNANVSAISYAGGTDPVIVTRSDATNQRLQEETRYASIDSAGRVGEADAGSQANGGTWLHQTFYGWDAGGGCQQPDQGAANNLCSVIRRGLGSGPDRVTYYTYSDEGRMLVQRQLDWPKDVITTAGYQAQYFEATVAIASYTDSVAGSGTVTSQTQGGGRRDTNTLFMVVTQTQSESPNGNAAGSSWANYQTTYKVDNSATSSVNTVNGNGTLCSNPGSPVANTGLACEADQPKFDGSHVTTTQYTYNGTGERITLKTPKAIAENQSGQYTFSYYGNADKDYSSTTVMAGWLRGVTDPSNKFVAFAYDAEGHQVRSWDRNATQGTNLSSWPGSLTSPPASNYTETLYTKGSDTSASTYATPGRYVLATRDAIGVSWTTYVVDGNGNRIGTRSPIGTAGDPTSAPSCPQPTTGQTYDTCSNYNKNDNLISTLRPMEANTANYGGQNSSLNTYDAFDNLVVATDPNGHVSIRLYDAVNRQVGTVVGRGVTTPTTATDYVPPSPPLGNNCFAKGSNSAVYDGPMPTNSMECWAQTAYDGVDNVLSNTDPNGNVAQGLFDADHRRTHSITPRSDGAFTNLVAVTLYDANGNATDVCSPREQSEGGADNYVCSSTATYASHRLYDVLDRVTSTTTYRAPGTADTTMATYDGDGNPKTSVDANGRTTSYSYDLLDHKTQANIPRASGLSYTTTWTYDGVGNVTSEQQPIDGTNFRITDHSYDADNRPVDSVSGASSATFSSTTTYNASTGTDVRTRNVYDLDGNIVKMYSPNAFTTSVSAPNALYMTASSFNADEQKTASYQPRYDAGTLTDPINPNQSNTQETQCPIGSPGGLGYGAGTGICTTGYTYDPAGNQKTIIWPTLTANGHPTSAFNYFDDNLLAAANTPSPVTSGQQVKSATYQYDGDGKQLLVTDANGIYTQTTYTADELASSVTKTPNGATTHVTTYAYDAGGNRLSTTDAVGNVSRVAYYPDGLTQSSTDGAGDVTSYIYDAVGNATQVMSPSGNAKDATNPNGTPTTNTYTYDNLLLSTLTPVSGATQRLRCYYYDQGTLKSGLTYSTSATTCPGSPAPGGFSYAYGADGRLSTETGTNGSSTLTFQYDANGNQTSAADTTSGITISPTYYADNLPRTVNQGNGRTSSMAYDGAGQQTADTSVPGSGTTYGSTTTYNDAEIISSHTGYSGLNGLATTSWTYDAGGRVTRQNNGNGSYDVVGYVGDGSLNTSTLWSNGSNVSIFESFVDGNYRIVEDGCYTCIGVGQLIGYRWFYSYDAAGRLFGTQASSPIGAEWQFNLYDHNGNRLSHQNPDPTQIGPGAATYFAYNADDTIATTTVAGLAQYSSQYTPSGVLTQDGCVAHGQDAFDRMSAVAVQTGAPTTCGTGPAYTTYAFDALNREASSTTGSAHTTITDAGLSSTPAVEAASSETAYLLTPSHMPLGLTNSSTAEFLTNDTRGSVATSTTSGQGVQCQIQYDPYGVAITPLSPTNPCESGSTASDILFQDGRRDSATGDYQMGARLYDPTKNAFLQPDHYQEGQPSQDLSLGTDPLTRNAYAFVDGDPVNHFDPTGHRLDCGDGDPSCGGMPCEFTGTCNTPPPNPLVDPNPGMGPSADAKSSPGDSAAPPPGFTQQGFTCVNKGAPGQSCGAVVLNNSPGLATACAYAKQRGGSCFSLGYVYGQGADWAQKYASTLGAQFASADAERMTKSAPGCTGLLWDCFKSFVTDHWVDFALLAASLALPVVAGLAWGVRGGEVVGAGTSLSLSYKVGWSTEQIAAADAKVAALNDAASQGLLRVTGVERAGTSAASRFRAAGGQVPSGADIDHTIDLQLGGTDRLQNLSPLDLSVNRSLGAQIACQIRGLPMGSVIIAVTIC